MTAWTFDDIPDQTGRTAIVTGAIPASAQTARCWRCAGPMWCWPAATAKKARPRSPPSLPTNRPGRLHWRRSISRLPQRVAVALAADSAAYSAARRPHQLRPDIASWRPLNLRRRRHRRQTCAAQPRCRPRSAVAADGTDVVVDAATERRGSMVAPIRSSGLRAATATGRARAFVTRDDKRRRRSNESLAERVDNRAQPPRRPEPT